MCAKPTEEWGNLQEGGQSDHPLFWKIRNPKIVAKTPDIQRISGVLVVNVSLTY